MRVLIIFAFILFIYSPRANAQVVILEEMKLETCLIHSVCSFYIPKDGVNRKEAQRAGFFHDKVVVRINELEAKRFKYKLCENEIDAIPIYWKSFEERLSSAKTVTVTGRKFRSTIVGNVYINEIKAVDVMNDIMNSSGVCSRG